MKLLHAPQTSAFAGKLVLQRGISRVAESGVRCTPVSPFRRSHGSGSNALVLRLKPTHRIALSSVGAGSRKEGLRPVKAAPDGIAPENAEAKSRGQILETAKAESASTIDAEQEPFRDSVESGQTIGEATTAVQFGADEGKRAADEAVNNKSKELFEQGKSGEATKAEEKPKEDSAAEMVSEVYSARDDEGSTHAFLDDEKQVDLQDKSAMGTGGQRAAESHTESH